MNEDRQKEDKKAVRVREPENTKDGSDDAGHKEATKRKRGTFS